MQQSLIQADSIAAVQQQFSGSTIKAAQNEQLKVNPYQGQHQNQPSASHQV